jgi:hypothetical protein
MEEMIVAEVLMSSSGSGETEVGAPLYRAGRRWRGGEAVTGGNGV